MNLELFEAAEQDLVEGFRFYEDQQSGIGSYFLDSLYSDIESLRLYAGIHRKVWGYHRLLSRRFPFAIYYLVDDSTVRIWRVLDCRRSPRWLRKQVRSADEPLG